MHRVGFPLQPRTDGERMNPSSGCGVFIREFSSTTRNRLYYFVVSGEPDIRIHDAPDDQISVEIKGVDVFDPAKGEVRSDDADGIACWFIDTDYDEESLFVRHAYFLGARDLYEGSLRGISTRA